MTDSHDLAPVLQQLEQELLTPATRHNAARLRQLLAAEFEEVGASGRVFHREEITHLLSQESAGIERALTLENFRARPLGENLVQVRYQSRSRSPGRDSDRLVERTSLWRHTGDSWTMLYHQGTPVPAR